MSESNVAPFRPLRFRVDRVGDLGAVWAPPYDVISPEDAVALRERSPHNIVRITNPEAEGSDRYAEAARALESWIADGVMARDDEPALYVHRHSFEADGESHVRTGVWALLKLAPFGAGLVLPHERTMKGPKADRLALMRACGAQLSPIFFICSDPEDRIGEALGDLVQKKPAERAELPAGQQHEVWRVEKPDAIEKLTALLNEQTFLIADGHHRYETALAYRDGLIEVGASATGPGSHQHVLAHIVPEGDPGLLLLPTHRVIGGASLNWVAAALKTSERFDITRIEETEIESIVEELEAAAGTPTFLLVARDQPGGWLMRLRNADAFNSISAVAFQEVFLPEGLDLSPEEQVERMTYVKDAAEALERVRSGVAQAAALLAAPTVAQVREAVTAGQRTPSKTTFFWPKVPTGVAIHLF